MFDGHKPSSLGSAKSDPAADLRGASSGRRVTLESDGEVDTLRIEAPSGELELTVVLTADGPVLRVSGASVELAATKTLKMSCETLAIETSADVAINVGGDLKESVSGSHTVEVSGASSLEAHRVSVASRLGSTEIRANDDVRIDGERIWLNR